MNDIFKESYGYPSWVLDFERNIALGSQLYLDMFQECKNKYPFGSLSDLVYNNVRYLKVVKNIL